MELVSLLDSFYFSSSLPTTKFLKGLRFKKQIIFLLNKKTILFAVQRVSDFRITIVNEGQCVIHTQNFIYNDDRQKIFIVLMLHFSETRRVLIVELYFTKFLFTIEWKFYFSLQFGCIECIYCSCKQVLSRATQPSCSKMDRNFQQLLAEILIILSNLLILWRKYP